MASENSFSVPQCQSALEPQATVRLKPQVSKEDGVATKAPHWAGPDDNDHLWYGRWGAKQAYLNAHCPTSFWPFRTSVIPCDFPYCHLAPASGIWIISPALWGAIYHLPSHSRKGAFWPQIFSDSSCSKGDTWNVQELPMTAWLMWLWRVPANAESLISVHCFQFAVQSFPGLPLAQALWTFFRGICWEELGVPGGRPALHHRAQPKAPQKQLEHVGRHRANGKTFGSRTLRLN